MNKELVFIEEKCTGCRLCELMCVLEKEGACGQSLARLRLVETDTLETYETRICRQCDEPECQAVCPEEAITRDRATGALVLDQEMCSGCRLCIEACPYEAVFWDDKREAAFKCDLCGGLPVCVAYCPKQALLFKDAEGTKG